MQGIDGLAEGPHDLRHIGLAALPAFDLQSGDPGGLELWEQLGGIEGNRILEDMKSLAVDLEAALAQGRVGGGLVGLELVDGHVAEQGVQLAVAGVVADMGGRRTDAVHVG